MEKIIIKDIREAMLIDRPTDKIVCFIDNRFVLAYNQYTDGTYSKDISIKFLDMSYHHNKSVIYGLTHLSVLEKVLKIVDKRSSLTSCYLVWNYYRQPHIKVVDYRKTKQRYRQLERGLKNHILLKKEGYEEILKFYNPRLST